MDRKASDSVFTKRQRIDLRLIIGEGSDGLYREYKQVLPFLEDAVRVYPTSQIKLFRREALKHANAARQFEDEVLQFCDTLKAIDGEANWRKYLPGSAETVSSRSLADLMRLRMPWPALDRSRAALEALLTDIRSWRARAGILARRPRGRGQQVEKRIRLAKWVGWHLVRVGIKLTDGASGQFARTLKVVYEAAGEKVPRDIFRDVHRAIQLLRQSYPHLVPAGPSQHKRSHKTSH